MRSDDAALKVVRDADANRLEASRPEAPVFGDASLYGVVGDWVRVVAPHTEAPAVAIYASALATAGVLLGRTHVWRFGNVNHPPLLWPLLVGPTGSGRKGTALSVGARELIHELDSRFASSRVVSGLSSAEGLIHQVRDGSEAVMTAAGKLKSKEDPGEPDKRLLVIEGELGGPLEAMARDGNRLSPILRDAWDGHDIRSLVKHDPQRSTAPHIGLLGAITPTELRQLFTGKAIANGFANRFLPIWLSRSQLIPDDTAPDQTLLYNSVRRVESAVQRAYSLTGSIGWTPDGSSLWCTVYPTLAVNEDPSDRLRKLLERGAPYVRRIAMVLALLDGEHLVHAPHLTAALALWQYAADTWRHVFADGAAFSPLALELLHALQLAGRAGLSRTEIREEVVRSNDVPAADIQAALCELLNADVVKRVKEPTAGRDREVWIHAHHVPRLGMPGPLARC